MTETRTNGGLSERDMQALDLTLADHLLVKRDLEDARAQIAELQSALAQAQVTIKALHEMGEFADTRMAKAVADRDQAVEQRAKYESFLDIIETAIPKLREVERTNHDKKIEA